MSTRLYVSNLPLSATEEMLTDRFGRFGGVVSVALEPVKRALRRGAFVEMRSSAEAQRAMAGINLSDFEGRLISVYLALSSVRRTPS